MKKIRLIIYYMIASKLPSSCYPFGKIFNRIRIKTLNKIIPIGENSIIERNVYIGDGNDVSIGRNCQINENVRLDNVSIGNNVMIARNVVFLGRMHRFDRMDIPMIEQGEDKMDQTIICDNVWIGINVIVMPGLTIKKGCILAAAAVLTKNTRENGIYGGVPAKLLRIRN